MPLEDFFIDYGTQDRAPGEFVTGIDVPRLVPGEVFRCYKISKRFDQDISGLLGAFRFTVEAGRVVHARVAYGGMAATPKRAVATEAALKDVWNLQDRDGWDTACETLATDFRPIDDMRASARYRLETAQALLSKALQRGGRRGERRDPARGPPAGGGGACRLKPLWQTGPHQPRAIGSVGRALAHDSALGHVQGTARYIDDAFQNRRRWCTSHPATPHAGSAWPNCRARLWMRCGPRRASWRC